MHPHHVDLVSHWRIAAPVETVWAALCTPEDWHCWWPGVCAVHTPRAGHAGGVQQITWATRLPWPLVIEIEALEALRPECLRGRMRGPLPGQGIWLLRPDGLATDVTCVWRVQLATRWMRGLALLLGPLLRRAHAGVMRAGCSGLARHLGVAAATSGDS